MKKGYINLINIIIVFIISIFFSSLLLNKNNSYFFQISYWSIFLIVLIFLVGYEKDKSLLKKDITENMFIYAFAYVFLEYLLGIFTGFLDSPYKHNLISIIQNILPITILIVIEEISRYIIITKSRKNKTIIVLSILLFTLFDLFINIGLYDINSKKGIFDIIVLLIVPSISKNILLTYTTYKGGYTPSITYRVILEIIIYLVPIFADLGDYIDSVFKIVLPMIFLYRLIVVYGKKAKIDIRKQKEIRKKATIVLIAMSTILWILVYLVSGYFKYYLVVVATGSMQPTINVGDAVIIEQIKDKKYEKIKKGQILAYRHDGKIIIHRVAEIKRISNYYVFKTKGDNNKEIDNWLVYQKQIIGPAQVKLKYIGIPTVILNKYLDK